MRNTIHNIFIVTAAFALVSCGNQKKDTTEMQNGAAADTRIKITQAQFDQIGMQLGSLEEKEFPYVVKTTGMIDVPPENRVIVNATMGGYIKTAPFLIGDEVKRGRALLTIENPEFVSLQQEYLEVSERLGFLKSEYDRQKTMYNENITSQKNYLKAQSEFKTAQAKYNGLRQQLVMLNISPTKVEAGNITSTATIYAPISGSVTELNVTKGSYVDPATPIMEIIDNDHIHLELSVFEKDIMRIKKGQNINFKIPEASSDSFRAEVHLVGTSIGEGRTIKVHGHLKEKSTFLTGMFVEADIITDTVLAKALPSESIVNVGENDYVLVLDKEEEGDYYFEKIEVGIKNRYGGFTKIENADVFNETDRFLTKGAFNLLGE